MAKKQHLVVYLDDVASDREDYKRLLEEDGRISVKVEIPGEFIKPEIVTSHNPSLAIIDYRLDTKQRSGPSATYKGTSYAAAVREYKANLPIVLLSRGSILRQRRYKSLLRDIIGAYDELILKDHIIEDAKGVVSKLISLIEGFQRLSRTRDRDWQSLLRALDAKKDESVDLIRANPPQEAKWRVPETARWIRSVILGYPGILYDSLHAATILGIQEKAFLSASVQEAFARSRYSGVFAGDSRRWWKRRLLLIASIIMDEAGMLGNPATQFAKAWKKLNKKTLNPSNLQVVFRSFLSRIGPIKVKA